MEKRVEDEKDVYDITLNYIAIRMQRLYKISVPFAKEQSSIECNMGSCIE